MYFRMESIDHPDTVACYNMLYVPWILLFEAKL